ncbi:hypothetical protein FNYG_14242 [Fusarium nygamai]|uniref:Uncharacterized protein n=1 Tax=Gibberella nygamai TaxID=42673 RepID=A0A2K0UTD3_GIBNY|nr:hypothetical protein FNYG_14242 [Fusarium nygamai]
MPFIFTIRLIPDPPTDGDTFVSSYLPSINITAFDRSVNNPLQDVQIGSASGPVPVLGTPLVVGSSPPSLTPSIVQHYKGVPLRPQAVATAIIVVKDDPTRPEFPDPTGVDVRLAVTRGFTKIASAEINFNVAGLTVAALSPDQFDYMGMTTQNPAFANLPTGIYLKIPGPLPSDTINPGPALTLDPKGTPPDFDAIVTSINSVLALDHPGPGSGSSLKTIVDPLTVPEIEVLAAELSYNRKIAPLPTPRISIEDLYSDPNPTYNEQERVRFEGALTAYYAAYDGNAQQLKKFVFIVFAAVKAEQLSFQQSQVTLNLPLDPAMATSTTPGTISVTLQRPAGSASLTPTFAIPAAYFYAIGLNLSTAQQPEKLFDRVLGSTPQFIRDSLTMAINSGAIQNKTYSTLTTNFTPTTTANLNQAVRRLTALSGSKTTKSKYAATLQGNVGGTLAGDVSALVQRWLGRTEADAQLLTVFWPTEFLGADYLELILEVISGGSVPLENGIRHFPGHTISKASNISDISDQEWITFFNNNITLLPKFLPNGNTNDRARLYVQFLRTLLAVPAAPTPPVVTVAGGIPTFGDYDIDLLARFLSFVPGGFNLDSFPSDSTINTALSQAFPGDTRVQAWLRRALKTLNDLYRITKGLGSQPDPMTFAFMEALFARGFRSIESVCEVTPDQFQIALQGTVAWASASSIYGTATQLGHSFVDKVIPDPIFRPVNPGSLVNCVPPEHLSTFGPVEYLREAWDMTANGTVLGDVIKARRGDIASLIVSKDNFQVQVPRIDLVNESLEFLGSNLPALAGAVLNTDPSPATEELERSLVTLPQHSTPAIALSSPQIYDTLASDFSSPALPYAQHLDVNRSYLELLGTSRFETMRTFQKDITELAMDPLHQPPDFQASLWRYPLQFGMALEYICLSRAEYEKLFASPCSANDISNLYGFPSEQQLIAGLGSLSLARFLQATGLDYCEFYELWETGLVPLRLRGDVQLLPECLPCCSSRIGFTVGEDAASLVPDLHQLIIFIRLFRYLQKCYCKKPDAISFKTLAGICAVLHLFDAQGVINPDFIRQLVSLLILRDMLCLPWSDFQAPVPPPREGEDVGAAVAPSFGNKTLLILWSDAQTDGNDVQRRWAIEKILSRIQHPAKARYSACPRTPSVKILAQNLDSISLLVGFSNDFPWYFNPSCTLRFVEVLAKIYASDFTAGEILFLFTTERHLTGDDPYPYTEHSESQEDPLNAPEDDLHGLWDLRQKLLSVCISEEEAKCWTWERIHAACHELGLRPSQSGDSLLAMGMKFFGETLEHSGHHHQRWDGQFTAELSPDATSPSMWHGDHCKVFHYTTKHDGETQAGYLWAQIPIQDCDTLQQLATSRQLKPAEAAAVQNVYFAPRAVLAPFALIFENPGHAFDWLIQEPCEKSRFRFFQQQFALFHKRCTVIGHHLAERVDALPEFKKCDRRRDCGCGCGGGHPNFKAAWLILSKLIADENRSTAPWEDDSGVSPTAFQANAFSGGAFAALLGLLGNGLKGSISTGHGLPFPELRGATSAFGSVRNKWNAPVPTYIPSLQLPLSPSQSGLVSLRNGFALADDDGKILGGAQPFEVTWTGSLLVEKEGHYCFQAGHPEDCCERLPSQDEKKCHRWLVTLQRGQKTWTLLNNHWEASGRAPARHSHPMILLRGAYAITIKFRQTEPQFTNPLDVHAFHTGFEVRYSGPDSGDDFCVLPYNRLFQEAKDGLLGSGVQIGGAAGQWLLGQYYSSFRDIRRTYQRAFKAILFARRFHLSAHQDCCDDQSELGYLLDHGDLFLGTSYYLDTDKTWKTHHAYLDMNFLPVKDSYGPAVTVDLRANPSAKRKAALFDWWERLFDYSHLKAVTKPKFHRRVWEMFFEAATQKPDNARQLIRYLDADMSLAKQALTFLASTGGTDQLVETTALQLEDERWAIRVSKAVCWLTAVDAAFYAKQYDLLNPALAASGDPSTSVGGASGNTSLINFLLKAANEEPKQLERLRCFVDGLREKGRHALIAYLCADDRVPLKFSSSGQSATASKAQDLSDLLLQDVEVGLRERASRIEDAIQAVQTFVQRAKIGLEPLFPMTEEFSETWDCRFSTFKAWQTWKRRSIYRENWIHWDDMERLEKSEALGFFGSMLKKDVNTIAEAARRMWWPKVDLPRAPGMDLVTAEQFAVLDQQRQSMKEGLPLMATPDRHGQPTLLAPQNLPISSPPSGEHQNPPGPPNPTENSLPTTEGSGGVTPLTLRSAENNIPGLFDDVISLPLWLKAAIRMGTRFLRVAASGPPSGSPCVGDADSNLTGQDADGQDADGRKDASKKPGVCCKCHELHAPTVDEYYFWLANSAFFSDKDAVQVANHDVSTSVNTDPTSEWDDETQLPGLLNWPKQPMVHLFWTRVHRGALDPLRRSKDGIPLRDASGKPAQAAKTDLTFSGRLVDSLFFSAADNGGGFRYDLATDTATVTPQDVTDTPAPPHPLSTYLTAWPYFLYFADGASLEPLDQRCLALEMSHRLSEDCQFQAAALWCRRAYDVLHRDSSWMRCPKQDSAPREGRNASTTSGALSTATSSALSEASSASLEKAPSTIEEASLDVTCCPTGPFGKGIQRSRAALLQYLCNALRWADHLIRLDSQESYRRADVILNTMQYILGPTPVTIESVDSRHLTVGTFAPLPAPINPSLLLFYEEVKDRKSLLRDFLDSSRHRNGRPGEDVAIWEGCLHRNEVCDQMQRCLTRCQLYRFSALLPKALEWAGMVKNLGSELLGAFEKGDEQYLSNLRASHELHILSLQNTVSQNAFRAADWDLQALEKTMSSAQCKATYYSNLIEAKLLPLEQSYQQGMESGMNDRTAGNIEESIGQMLNMIPDFYVGFPAALSHLPIGTKLSMFFSALARVQNTLGDIDNTNANLALTQGGWQRRADEWQQTLDTTEIEIEQIKRQQLASARRRYAALLELNIQQRQGEHSKEVLDFLRDRTSAHSLYSFLQQETAKLYRQAFRLALDAAKEAQVALWHELGEFTREDPQLDFSLSESSLWSSLHEGLLAGEKLELALRALERKYMACNRREFEMTRHFSLRQYSPWAFLLLKIGRECEVEIPEWWLDLDHPGHYMRRLKQVSLSLPCTAGPLTGVHCQLQLLRSTTRFRPLIPRWRECCCGEARGADERARCVKCACGPDARRLPDDPNVLTIHHTSSAHSAIATSMGNADAGVFDSSLEQPRYLPFEFAGAASKWRIKLPAENNAFRVDTLSDVILHVTYTSREGGEELQREASAAVCGRMAGDGVQFLDLRHEMAEQFSHAFRQPLIDESARRGKPVPARKCHLQLSFTKNMFPFTHGNQYRAIWITKVHVFVGAMDFSSKSRSCACPRGAGACSKASCHKPEKPAANSFQVEYRPPGKTRWRRRARECCCDERRECSDCRSSRHRPSHSRARDSRPRKHDSHTQEHSCRDRAKRSSHKKTIHFNDVSSASSSGSESESGSDDDSQCKLKVQFPLVRLPTECHPHVGASDCLPSTYYGIFQPVRPLGPILDSREGERWQRRGIDCHGQDLGVLVFPLGLEKMDVENAFFLVEFHYGPCGGGVEKERCEGLEDFGPQRGRTLPQRGI